MYGPCCQQIASSERARYDSGRASTLRMPVACVVVAGLCPAREPTGPHKTRCVSGIDPAGLYYLPLPPTTSQVGDRIQVQWLLKGGAKAWFGGSVAGHRHSAHGASRPFIAYDDGLNQEHSHPLNPNSNPNPEPRTPNPTLTPT